jgi:filamentous hemagglutinin
MPTRCSADRHPHRRMATAATLRTGLRATAQAAREVLGFALLTGAAASSAFAQAAPNPCSASVACSYRGNPITDFATRGVASVVTQGALTTVQQRSDTALLNWRSFDVGAGQSVVFKQPGVNSVAINRIHDTRASRIDGNLSANGQVYLINPNGLLFGSGANVDVAGLIASTLDIADARVTNGLLGGNAATAAFSVVADSAAAAEAAVRIRQGAVIKAGNVFVFAPHVGNEGAISVADGGQVVLAAGKRVFLAGSESATLRGLLVEVGQGGTVTHSGDIVTPRGNTTLVGMAVNHAGRITATSAINENGSIRLLAREVASAADDAPAPMTGSRPTGMFLNVRATGRIDLQSGATTQVLLDATDRGTAPLDDATAAAARSSIAIDGGQVVLGGPGTAGRTLLQAKGGDVIVQARSDLTVINDGETGTPHVLGAVQPAATLVVGADVKIDVSGERDAAVDGNRNYVEIERLTSNDLRDAPLQRDGFLRGQKVHLNVAQDHAFIDVSGRRASVSGTQAERNAAGGVIALRAEGRLDVAAGARFDLSGGSTLTTAASGRSSQLVAADGRTVDIANARADERYVGFADRFTAAIDSVREGLSLSRTYDAPVLGHTAALREGRSAGTLEINAPRGGFAGTIAAGTSAPSGQRGKLPAGGRLRVGSIANGTGSIDKQIAYSRPNVLLTNDLASAGFEVPAAQSDRLLAFDVGMLRDGGITRLDVLSDGVVTVAGGAAIDVGPRGSISLQGNAVDVKADLTARGGSIVVGERPRSTDDLAGSARSERNLVRAEDRGRIRFAGGVALDASGLHTSDLGLPTGETAATAIVRDGGSIAIDGRRVDVSGVRRFDVDAGASVSSAGAATGGRAGSLSLLAGDSEERTADQADLGVLVLGEGFAGRIAGFGFGAGGSLTLGAPDVSIGMPAAAGTLTLDAAIFDRGFERFDLRAGDSLVVQAGTRIEPPVRQYAFRRDEVLPVHGADLSEVLQPQASLAPLQRPARIDFSAARPNGTLRFETGSTIAAGAQGTITALAGQSIVLDGAWTARGGSAALSLGKPSLEAPDTGTIARFERQAIQLGEHASIDVSGQSRVFENAAGVRSGAVLDGGSVAIAATRGSVAIAEGARIVADGARDSVDLRRGHATVRTEVASRGGAVSIAAQQALLIEGTLSGRSGGAGVEGGRLSVRLEGLTDSELSAPANPADLIGAIFRADRVLTLNDQSSLVPLAGAPFRADAYAGRGHVKASLLNDSGFDTVLLGSTHTIHVPTSLSVTTASSLTLDAQAIKVGSGSTLSLASQHLELGFQPRSSAYAAGLDGAASGGSASLHAQARDIDLVGGLALQGVGSTTLAAQDNLQLRGGGHPSAARPQGALASGGHLTIRAAQLTPASMTDYRIDLSSNPSARLVIAPSGAAPLEPLSAAGSVTLRASEIEIGGRVAAPHGGIDIEAARSVTLAPGASLSVAGTLAVPLGTVFNGTQWVYADNPNTTANNIASSGGVTLPAKRIRVAAPQVDVDPAARLDVSGGGEMVAQEFVAGPGGSFDLRQNFVPSAPGGDTLQRSGFFALVPARGDSAAPFDPHLRSDLTGDAAIGGAGLLRAGQTITLGAGSAIPAGTYTVLPARYALLPGAFALQAVSGHADLTPGAVVREAAGTAIVAGRIGVGAGRASNARWSGYRVYDGAQIRRHAEWREYRGSDLIAAAAAAAAQPVPRTPLDAGALSVSAQQLRLSTGSVAAAAGRRVDGASVRSGRGAELSLAAPHLIVTDQPAAVPVATSDTLILQAADLTALKAETLVLGAAATRGADGSLTLDGTAATVRVGGAQRLSAGEVLLAASERVSVAVGSAIEADATQAAGTSRVVAAGDGAALLVSNAKALPVWQRTGTLGERGDLAVAESAQLSGRSLLFDASRQQRYAASVDFDARNIGLSAFSINFGEAAGSTRGLNLGNALLAQLSNADSLTLTSGSTFSVHGQAAIGGAGLGSLVLDGAGFVAQPGASASVTAGDVTLRNSAATLPSSTPSPGSGSLSIHALGPSAAAPAAQGTITFAGGAIASNGFADTTARANGSLVFAGQGSLAVDGALLLDAGRIGAGRAAEHRVEASGALRTLATAAAPIVSGRELGARLSLAGERIDHGGRIELPSGELSLAATGAGAADHVTLAAASRISVAGSRLAFADQVADASAGQVTLASAHGSVRALAGSTLDLAGAGTQGDAGGLRVQATHGSLQLDGALGAGAGSAARGATVQVDVGMLPDLGVLAEALAGNGQAQEIDVRVRTGDTTLAAGQTLSAHSMRIAVDGRDHAARPADGRLRIDGTLDASGPRAGRIELHARDGIALGTTALIAARSSGAGEEGGTVLLSARINEGALPAALDALRIASGAKVDVGAAADAVGGSVTLRAPRVGNDVAIDALPAYLHGAREEIVEATVVKRYDPIPPATANDTTQPAVIPQAELRGELTAFMSDTHRSAMTARLGRSGDTGFHLRPGLELRSSGIMKVSGLIDFAALDKGTFQWRYGGNTLGGSEPGALTLRAAGKLTLAGGLSDGFHTLKSGNGNALLVPFEAADSWRFQLTGGADMAAASAASTGTAGDVALERAIAVDRAFVRTGTGRIDIAAAGRIELTAKDSAIYTGGNTAPSSSDPFANAKLNELNPRFAERGGGIRLEAGADIASTKPSTQLINNWLWRAGRSTEVSGTDGTRVQDFSGADNAPTSWWVNTASFLQGIGALGGGDVTLRAGGDIRGVTAVVPTHGRLALTAEGRAGEVVERNGGALDVRAAGSLISGAYYAQRGAFDLRADRIAQESADPMILAQGDNVARVQARTDIDLFGSFNPTWAAVPNMFKNAPLSDSPASTAFSTYGERSALDVRSIAGDVRLDGSFVTSRLPSTNTGNNGGLNLAEKGLRPLFEVLPGSLDLVAFGGDIALGGTRMLAPSASGQLRVLADGAIDGSNGRLVMAALDPRALPSVEAPVPYETWRTGPRSFEEAFRGARVNNDGKTVASTDWGLGRRPNYGSTLLHGPDALPVSVVARSGDIASLTLELPKPLQMTAGGDIRDLNLLVQHPTDSSVSQVHAGGRFVIEDPARGIAVTGPGVAELLAGAAIDLGASSKGLVSQGRLVNPNLPAGGATLLIAAGLGRGADGFVQQPDYANAVRQFVRHDAFAATGAAAAALNAQVLAEADFGPESAAVRVQLADALSRRDAAAMPGSTFDRWLAGLPAATRMRVALALVQRVQAVANQRFVATANTESFAPGYLGLGDLFPGLSADLSGLRQFVSGNPFAGATDADALRREALQDLPEPLRNAMLQGLADPSQADDAASAFNRALGDLDAAMLRSASRDLLAAVQRIAGRELDALRTAGRVKPEVGTPFARGLDALARAFSPAGPVGRNDITLVFSQIKAEQSGGLFLLAPRGGVVAGQANPPAGVAEKPAYDLGLLTFGGGGIHGMVRDNFDVYRSRVFTVAGGDIHLWASLGNIDAGRGPRDTTVAPPPRLLIDDVTGIVTLDVSASVSGSGIGALKTRDDQPPSNIRLIAPNGFIDAGEAGIRADSGTVTLGTNIVLNAGNINAGGGVSGGAVVVAPPAPVPTSSNSAQTEKATEQAQKALAEQQRESDERAKKERRKRVTGEFLGFGEGQNRGEAP